MIDFRLGRYALGAAVMAAAMLAGCGGTQPPIGVPSGNTSQKVRNHKLFRYTGNEQQFKVPAHVTEITLVALGAAGDFRSPSYSTLSGSGGRVTATIPVKLGETLYVFVGGKGGINGGYNGGGAGGGNVNGYQWGRGGGGASDIRQRGDALSDRVIVAGGGGGAAPDGGSGGAGGGTIGASGGSTGSGPYESGGGGGGTQEAGGAGGAGPSGSCSGGAGTSGVLGQGGEGGEACFQQYYGGGGGGGYYGGGGGSSYVEKQATRVKSSQGTSTRDNGRVTIYWISS